MATVYKILGQQAPSANTVTTLYTVPSSTQTVVSTLSICNTNSSNITANVVFIPNGGSISSNSYVVSGATIAYNDTMLLTLGFSLGTAGDEIQVYANTANVSFNLFGSEVS